MINERLALLCVAAGTLLVLASGIGVLLWVLCLAGVLRTLVKQASARGVRTACGSVIVQARWRSSAFLAGVGIGAGLPRRSEM